MQSDRSRLLLNFVAAFMLGSFSLVCQAEEPKLADKSATTDGQILISGKPLKYKSTAGVLVIKDDAGKPKAEMFYVAYAKTGEDPARRPITFVFNGGPGAAAVWLHLGTAGPKRVPLDAEGFAPPPPYRLENNTDTWLPATDLVFIDPVGTGYSRPAPGEKPEQFYGIEEDVKSVGDFIQLYTTRNDRWLSPKFLAGESYGTTRAAGLSEHLLDSRGMAINGIIFISAVLEFRTIMFHGGNDLPYPLYLPSYTAIARHFKKLPADLQNADLNKTLKEVEQFALHDYMDALTAGSAMAKAERAAVIDKLSRYTGLSRSYIEKSHLRINPGGFRKELLGSEQKVMGRFDARVTGFDDRPLQESAEFDPSLSPYLAVYTATFMAYCRNTLLYTNDRSYDVLSGRVHPWNWGAGGNGYPETAHNLASAMIKNPKMKVLFCNGTADLATPYLATDFTVRQLTLSDELRSNISHKIYDGGHMIYHVHDSLKQLGKDVRSFIADSYPPAPPAPATEPATRPAKAE